MSKKTYIGYWSAGNTYPESTYEFTNFREACHVMYACMEGDLLPGWNGYYWIKDENGKLLKKVNAQRSFGGGISCWSETSL